MMSAAFFQGRLAYAVNLRHSHLDTCPLAVHFDLPSGVGAINELGELVTQMLQEDVQVAFVHGFTILPVGYIVKQKIAIGNDRLRQLHNGSIGKAALDKPPD